MDGRGIAFIGDADSVLGFRALGVRAVVPGEGDLAEEFGELVRQGFSTIIVTEDLYDELEEEILEVAPRPLPAVIVLPGISGGAGRGEKAIRQLITRAVGVDLMGEEI